MAGNNNFFPSASLTSSGRPVLLPNEVECQLLSAVDLEDEDVNANFSPLKSGVLILTTHRLLWLPSNSISNSTATAIPLSFITCIFSSKKSIKSIFHSPRIRFQVSVHSKSLVVTLVLRGKGDSDGFLAKFLESWNGRAWETDTGGSSSGDSAPTLVSGASSNSGGFYSSDGSVRMVGVAGILRKEQQMWESTDKSLQEAFQDLNALMSKAKEMMTLAEKMRQKLLSGSNSHSADTNEEMGSKEEMQDWLLSVGIISPVTKESAGALYHQQLSRQIFARIKALITRPDALQAGITATDAAMTLGIAPAMAKEHLLTAESKGLLCRDISPDGFCFYVNLFSEIDSDDVFLVKDHGVYSLWVRAVSAL
ncbi:vacuolar protein sorting-associated protein 36 isoform X3 [Ricinus communis]|uniref:vacuolar protein sorting-associated protein 36 isoform X3 n=1 Tax=Ricinus communis TaxID=3988 RepID=UPI0007722BBA|nr:vacuolar protein sorting-associated protein 36 isoform X3 [Ricinus communis]|eukprot:XP_015574316.1 vacuolar protein sorting-associated protein 36 isoform X2 [Ricinus communis]